MPQSRYPGGPRIPGRIKAWLVLVILVLQLLCNILGLAYGICHPGDFRNLIYQGLLLLAPQTGLLYTLSMVLLIPLRNLIWFLSYPVMAWVLFKGIRILFVRK